MAGRREGTIITCSVMRDAFGFPVDEEQLSQIIQLSTGAVISLASGLEAGCGMMRWGPNARGTWGQCQPTRQVWSLPGLGLHRYHLRMVGSPGLGLEPVLKFSEA